MAQKTVSAYVPVITQTCEGFTYSHSPYRNPNESLGDAVAYEYEIAGAGETATTAYSPNEIISVTYDDPDTVNNSLVMLRASYVSGFQHQLGQSRIISEPCAVEAPFEGVMAYTPVITQTCEGFTYSHTNFRSPNEFLGDAERYDIVIAGDGAMERQAYTPDTVISVTYEDSSVQHSSEVRLFADYGDGTWFQLGVTQIAPQPCEIEEPGDNGSEEPGDNGDVSTETDEETPATDDTEVGTNDENTADAEDADPEGDPVEVSSLPSTGSGSTNAGLLALASAAVVLLGGAAMITRFGILRR